MAAKMIPDRAHTILPLSLSRLKPSSSSIFPIACSFQGIRCALRKKEHRGNLLPYRLRAFLYRLLV